VITISSPTYWWISPRHISIGLGDRGEHRGEEAMCLERPDPLGDRGRAHHVDEKEEASLGVGPAILSEQKRHERAVADEARGLKHHHQDGNGHEREANRNQPVRAL
jgi:hypothetical protein